VLFKSHYHKINWWVEAMGSREKNSIFFSWFLSAALHYSFGLFSCATWFFKIAFR